MILGHLRRPFRGRYRPRQGKMGERPENQAQGYGPGLGQWLPAGFVLAPTAEGMLVVEFSVFIPAPGASGPTDATAGITPAEAVARVAVVLN